MQTQTATISGTATDPAGAALINAKVEATNTGTNISRPGTLSTDLSLTKETKLTEPLNVDSRAEVFDWINHFNSRLSAA